MNSNLHLRKVATIIACLAATTMFVQAQTWPPAGMNGDGATEQTAWEISIPEHLKTAITR